MYETSQGQKTSFLINLYTHLSFYNKLLFILDNIVHFKGKFQQKQKYLLPCVFISLVRILAIHPWRLHTLKLLKFYVNSAQKK